MRLDLALIRLHPELSRRKAREAIEKGQVDVDGRTVVEPGHAVTEAVSIRTPIVAAVSNSRGSCASRAGPEVPRGTSTISSPVSTCGPSSFPR